MESAYQKALNTFKGAFWANLAGLYRTKGFDNFPESRLLVWDDDFYQAYLLLESLKEGFSFEGFQKKLLMWYLDRPDGIGLTTFRTLSALSSGASPIEAVYGSHIFMRGRSAGNAPLMRSFSIPVFLICRDSLAEEKAKPRDGFTEIKDFVRLNYFSALSTHFDPLAAFVSSLYGFIFLARFYGFSCPDDYRIFAPDGILEEMKDLFEKYGADREYEEYRRLYSTVVDRFLKSHSAGLPSRPRAFCVHTYIVFERVLKEFDTGEKECLPQHTYEKAVLRAISFGGDRDTQAEVTGAYFAFRTCEFTNYSPIPNFERIERTLKEVCRA